ncbi:pilus assembly protein PilN [Lamprobacter modestohalophilus]|uniref:Pilus assembly protein PilN n=1 Tax=Lamprobacter modestohalophilus TaxID=1064514 RepID=A0A9X1B532_9GAMM|nr:PilN domain-containing protein [Lamprobacter modestohalophilus]MBK1619679.1 pilus assembly protein PilN [Lamprobacter modestohalophilus]MCF7976608.1 PilN domain-containing protein [Chromatiaceae bacterium]MCF8014904.1 PilN domain-containing protein [Chromatiaceae bacterium]
MARINLLPWREQERRRRQRDLVLIAVAALGSVLLIGVLLKVQFDAMTDAQRARNLYLEGQITVLNRRIREINELEKQKADLLARMGVIQELQESRPEIVHLLDRLVDAVPVGVFLTRLQQEGARITIEGRAQSNARVSALMRNIESSAWIGKPELLLIENKDETGTGFSHFRLRFEQQRLQPDAGEDAIALTVGRR